MRQRQTFERVTEWNEILKFCLQNKLEKDLEKIVETNIAVFVNNRSRWPIRLYLSL